MSDPNIVNVSIDAAAPSVGFLPNMLKILDLMVNAGERNIALALVSAIETIDPEVADNMNLRNVTAAALDAATT